MQIERKISCEFFCDFSLVEIKLMYVLPATVFDLQYETIRSLANHKMS